MLQETNVGAAGKRETQSDSRTNSRLVQLEETNRLEVTVTDERDVTYSPYNPIPTVYET